MNIRTAFSRTVAVAAWTAVAAVGLTGVAAAGTESRTDAGRRSAATDGGFGWTAVRKGVPDRAVRFELTSPQIRDGGRFPASAYADAFGCSGGNQQITLHWRGAPAQTRSYAVTMFDPDAPTGSGFWHWMVWDIPATATGLGHDAPAGSVAGTDDAGVTGYLGPCPPAGDVAHHYQVTVYALDTATLSLPATTPAAVTAFTMSGHVIGYARITATAVRG